MGYRISVITADFGVPDCVTDEGIEIHHLPSTIGRGVKGLRWIHPRLTDVVKRLRTLNPDIIYFQCASGVLAACAWYAHRAKGTKLIYAAASDADFRPGRIFGLERRESWLYQQGLRRSHEVIVQNLEQQRLLRQQFGKEGLVLPNFYAEKNIADAVFGGSVIWVGTISRIKRPELLLALATRFPRESFVMVGGPAGSGGLDGSNRTALDYYHEIEGQARQLSNVEFAGFVPYSKVGGYFDRASILVSTSEFEGLPNVFLQAWIRNIPTLSFVSPTTSEESTGTIPCRDLDDMSGQLMALLSDSGRWLEASLRAKHHFNRWHSWDAVMPKYDGVFCGTAIKNGGSDPLRLGLSHETWPP
jgi:glycosyltransferase involved in cell wall biosynthesis